MEFVSGMVVISSAGHDCGRWFVVTGADSRYVYIADGKERRVASPKKKNIRHVLKTNAVIAAEDMTDKRLRSALRALSAKSIAEESE